MNKGRSKMRKRFAVVFMIICLLFTSTMLSGCDFSIDKLLGRQTNVVQDDTKHEENSNENDNNPEDEHSDEHDDGDGSGVLESGDIAFHFLELGNQYTGDCTYIKAGDVDILIDAGSRTNSISTITKYINNYVTDGKLEYVIVTHAHEDHYSGFATSASTNSIFDLYEVGIIIDFALTNQKDTGTMYNNYKRERDEAVQRGAVHYTADDCIKKNNGANDVYEIYDGITMKILEQKFYYTKSTDENNYSVCTLFTQGEHNFLFTGDLEKEGEASLVSLNNLPHCDLFKAGHHGSKTSSNNSLLSVITPDICCVCCCAGNVEYTQANENRFPTQDFIDRISQYTDKVYVTTLGFIEYNSEKAKYVNSGFTSMNGNIIVLSNKDGVSVNCSNNNTVLKDTDWFKENRNCPDVWAG